MERQLREAYFFVRGHVSAICLLAMPPSPRLWLLNRREPWRSGVALQKVPGEKEQ